MTDRRAHVLGWAPPVLGLALWGWGVATTDPSLLPEGGLLPRLPWPWWAGLVLVVVSAVTAAYRPRLHHGRLGALLAVLLVQLYVTAPVLEDAPRYTYTYKHVAVAQYIQYYGSVDSSIDIYHRWPGFFSLSAWFSQLSGLYDPTSYAAWAEVWFTAIDALLVWACAHAVARSTRTAWLAAVTFTVTNWIGQDYYSPQAFGYVLMLGVLLLCLSTLRSVPSGFGRWFERTSRRVLRVRADDRGEPAPLLATRTLRGRAVALAVLLDAVLAASHQLTPYVLLLQLGALVVAGYLRPWWLLVVAATATLGYLVPNYDFVKTFGLFSSPDPLANAANTAINGVPDRLQRLITDAALLSLLMSYLLAFSGCVRRARRGWTSDAVVVAALAFAPIVLLGANNYGGEARLRVFLYSLPWLCVGSAWFWSPEGRARVRRGLVMPVATTLVLTACFLAFFLGREDVSQLSPDEVGAAAYVFDASRTPAGANVLLTAPSFPARYGPLYFRLSAADLPSLSGFDFGKRPLLFPTQKDADAVVTIFESLKGNGGYLVFSQGQAAYARDFQQWQEHALPALEGVIAQNPHFQLVYDRPKARVYRFVQTP